MSPSPPPTPTDSGNPALVRWLCRWVAASQRHAWQTLAASVCLSAALGVFAVRSLGFNVDPNALFSPDLRFQRMIQEFSRHFPVLTDSLLVVVDGDTPEATRDAQQALARALTKRSDAFHRVFLPGEEPFFERTGLLYADVPQLEQFADDMALLQPVIAELANDASLPTLTRMIRLGLQEIGGREIDTQRWADVLNHFRNATASVFDEHPVAISWESVLLAGSGFDPTTLRVIVAEPILDLTHVLAAQDGIEAVREAIRELGLADAPGLRVRITGYPALNHEEMLGLATDTGVAGGLSFALVVVVLGVAFRSRRMVFAAAVTLIVGLIWTAAFAGVSVSELNPVSIAFGILVIGLGVDFMIHLGMHFTVHVRAGRTLPAALEASVRDTGAALVLCAATTAVGFLAFVPTDYRGVSDLGLIAAGGMLVMLFQTFTLFPALLRLLYSDATIAMLGHAGSPRRLALPSPPNPWAVCVVAAALGLGALPLLPRVDLDANVIRLRNPDTESVQAFEDLLASNTRTPWYIDVLAPSLPEAIALAREMRALPEVDRAVTLADFIPEAQAEKLEILSDVALFLDIPASTSRTEVAIADQIAALEELRDFLDVEAISRAGPPLAVSAARLREALDVFLLQVGADPNAAQAALAELERTLLAAFPKQLERLRANLFVEPVTQDDLPPTLVSRMLADDGSARIQVYPANDLSNHDAMVEFVEAIRPISGDITGLPVNLVESARATWASLLQALAWSVLAITALLLVMWQRVGDTAIALGPLLLAVLLTQVSTVVLPIAFTFGSVIVLPLMLGIGIDAGVHLVHRANQVDVAEAELLDTTTARAVLFSAITTIASFGTLVLSNHGGIKSLGLLLVTGMFFTLAANLVLLPALLTLRQRRRLAVTEGRSRVCGAVFK